MTIHLSNPLLMNKMVLIFGVFNTNRSLQQHGVADLMRAPGTIWQNSETAVLLEIADANIDAAKQLGVRGKGLVPEIRNWLLHLKS